MVSLNALIYKPGGNNKSPGAKVQLKGFCGGACNYATPSNLMASRGLPGRGAYIEAIT